MSDQMRKMMNLMENNSLSEDAEPDQILRQVLTLFSGIIEEGVDAGLYEEGDFNAALEGDYVTIRRKSGELPPGEIPGRIILATLKYGSIYFGYGSRKLEFTKRYTRKVGNDIWESGAAADITRVVTSILADGFI